MPSVSDKQKRLMEMASKVAGRKTLRTSGHKVPPLKVAQEFRAADRAKARKRKGK